MIFASFGFNPNFINEDCNDYEGNNKYDDYLSGKKYKSFRRDKIEEQSIVNELLANEDYCSHYKKHSEIAEKNKDIMSFYIHYCVFRWHSHLYNHFLNQVENIPEILFTYKYFQKEYDFCFQND